MTEISVHLMHGVNLNLLGTREPSKYGSRSLLDLVQYVREYSKKQGFSLRDFQSNDEKAFVEYIHALEPGSWVVCNTGAWTHTSVAIRDAFAARGIQLVEVHLSQVHAREEFRHRSYISAIAKACISGQGFDGYARAIDYIRTTISGVEAA